MERSKKVPKPPMSSPVLVDMRMPLKVEFLKVYVLSAQLKKAPPFIVAASVVAVTSVTVTLVRVTWMAEKVKNNPPRRLPPEDDNVATVTNEMAVSSSRMGATPADDGHAPNAPPYTFPEALVATMPVIVEVRKAKVHLGLRTTQATAPNTSECAAARVMFSIVVAVTVTLASFA
jgi:hypothetical protein